MSGTSQRVVAENADIHESLEFFGPIILAGAGAAASGASGVSGESSQQSCLPAALRGKLFTYDSGLGQYVSATDPSVPPQNVRFVLYKVDGGGSVVLPLSEIGYLEAGCRGQLPTDTLGVTLSRNGVDVVEFELRGFLIDPPDFIFGASPVTLRDSTGADVLSILAVADGTAGKYLNETVEIVGGLESVDAGLQGLHASVGLRDSLNESGLPEPPIEILAAGANQTYVNSDWWRVSVGMVVEPDGSLLNIFRGGRAPLEYEDQLAGQNHNGIYACFSGSYDAPLVQDAAGDGGCATGIIDTPLPLSAQELSAIQQGYLGLLSLLETVTPVWGIAMEILTP